MNLKSISLSALFIFALVPSTSCLLSPAYAEEANIKIGWMGPLSGDAAVLGADSMPAAQIVFDEVNAAGGVGGKKIELLVEDDQYLTAKAITSYKKLVHQDKVNVIVALTYGAIFALAEQAQRDNVLLIDPLDCDESIAKLPENVVCIAKRTEDLGIESANYAKSQGAIPSAIIYFDGDPFMGAVAESAVKRFEELGVQAPLMLAYNSNSIDFRSHLLRVKSFGAKSIFFYGYDTLGQGMRDAKALGFQVPFVGLNTVESPGFKKLAGDALEGAAIALWQSPRGAELDAFREKFVKKMGRGYNFETSMIPSYDIAKILVEALKNGAVDASTGKPDVAAIKKHLYGLKNYQGLGGNITMDPDGITRSFPVRMFLHKQGVMELAK
jgi:branched-chain amino acid transport system substrate-binding protein